MAAPMIPPPHAPAFLEDAGWRGAVARQLRTCIEAIGHTLAGAGGECTA